MLCGSTRFPEKREAAAAGAVVVEAQNMCYCGDSDYLGPVTVSNNEGDGWDRRPDSAAYVAGLWTDDWADGLGHALSAGVAGVLALLVPQRRGDGGV